MDIDVNTMEMKAKTLPNHFNKATHGLKNINVRPRIIVECTSATQLPRGEDVTRFARERLNMAPETRSDGTFAYLKLDLHIVKRKFSHLIKAS